MKENNFNILMVGALAGHLRGYINCTTILSPMCRKYLMKYYEGHKDYHTVNWDAIDIHWQKRRGFKYGNLYTYMLCHGVIVPYYQWTHTRRYKVPGFRFIFSPSKGTVGVVDTATNLLVIQ